MLIHEYFARVRVRVGTGEDRGELPVRDLGESTGERILRTPTWDRGQWHLSSTGRESIDVEEGVAEAEEERRDRVGGLDGRFLQGET